MNHQTITIHTTTPEGAPIPSVDLLADLIDSVLKVPKMRTVSVRVDQIAASAERKFRVRNVDVLGTKPAVSAVKRGGMQHYFELAPNGQLCICGQPRHAICHVASSLTRHRYVCQVDSTLCTCGLPKDHPSHV